MRALLLLLCLTCVSLCTAQVTVCGTQFASDATEIRVEQDSVSCGLVLRVPAAVSTMTTLEDIVITQTDLMGTFPDWSGLTNMRHLFLYDNQFTGTIHDLSLLTELVELVLSFNNMEGKVPNLDANTKLRRFDLDGDFVGTLPSFSQLTQLHNVAIQNTQLSGTFPKFASPDLTYVTLSNSLFQGTLPHISVQQGGAVDLSGNRIRGAILDYYSTASLYDLKLANNHWSCPTADYSGWADTTDYAQVECGCPSNGGWSWTKAGGFASIVCASDPDNDIIKPCDANGEWQDSDTSQCARKCGATDGWPRTVAGASAVKDCTQGTGQLTRLCDQQGQWSSNIQGTCQVQPEECTPEGLWQRTAIGEMASVVCDRGVGIQNRMCSAGGVWGQPDDTNCMCSGQDGFLATPQGSSATKGCPFGQRGIVTRLCQTGAHWDVAITNCVVSAADSAAWGVGVVAAGVAAVVAVA